MGKKLRIISFIMVGLLGGLQLALAETVLLDNTDNTEGWMVFNDAAASGSVKVTSGPNRAWKGLEFSYNLSGGNWVAFIKKIPAGMERMQALIFYYRGDGDYNLEVKVQETGGAVFGIKIPGGADVEKWMKLVIPIDKLEYLWGGNTRTLDPQNIRQFEIAVSSEGKGSPGKMMISNIRYSMKPMQASLPKGKAPVKAEESTVSTAAFRGIGNVDIGQLSTWAKYADKGAAITTAIIDGPSSGEKALDVQYSWGKRAISGVQEETGVWVAVVKQINMDLSEMRNLTFMYKGSGAAANLEVKVVDPFGVRYGRIYPSGSLSSQWRTITIPRSDFKYMWGGDGTGKFDWSHVKNLEVSLSRTVDPRDSGMIQLSNFKFESAVSRSRRLKGAQAAPVATSGQIQAVIDGFTDLNPNNRYFVVVGDDSTLALDSSRITFQADYSMRMRYQLQSNQPNGSWVEIQRRFSPALEWTHVESVKIWVKGDGSRNIFRFTITDGEGRKWVNDNTEVLASTDWYLVDMPIDTFVLFEDLYAKRKSKKADLKNELHTIRQIGMAIITQPDRSNKATGEIYVEKLYVVGKNIKLSTAVPVSDRPPVGIAVPLKNWNLGGTSNTLLETINTTGTNIIQNLKFKITGNYEKFSVFGEIDMASTFGDEDDGIRSKSATLAGSNVNVTLLDPLNGINSLIIGNLWFNASPHIFANNNQFGGWGFKGVQAEGWLDQLHHRTYFLKHAPESFTFAGHYSMTLDGFNFNLMGTYYNQATFIASATKLEEDDTALLFEVSRNFFIPEIVTVKLAVFLGYNWYQQYWDTTIQEAIDKGEEGSYLAGEINFSDLSNIFWPGLSLTGKYRRVSPEYKPIYREDPYSWDGEIGDTDGYAARLYQAFAGAYITAEYQQYARISDESGRTENTIISIGYNDWKSVDMALTQEFKSKKYKYTDNRFEQEGEATVFDDDRQELISRLSIAYHFSGTFIVQEDIEYKSITQFATDETYSEMFSTIKVLYTPAPNLTFSLENKFSRYGREQDIPIIDTNEPFSIYEYTRLRVDLNF